jgi:hypothetical protein
VPVGNLRTEGDLARFIDAETALTLTEGVGGTPGGGPPSGPAGGALTGWYPDPDLDAAIAGAGLSFDSNVLSVDGSTGVLTTKGDLLSHNGSEGRLAVGANTQVLTADSSQAFGLKWADATGGGTTGNAAYSVTIGDNSSTSFNVPHNLGTRDVVVSVREADDPWHAVEVDWEAKTTNAVSVEFLTAPATASMRVTVLSNGDSSSGSYPPKVTELPVSPTDGNEVYFVVEDGLWHLRYDATTERWNFLGGPPLSDLELGSSILEGGPYDTWRDVAPGPPSITVPLFGSYAISHQGSDKITRGVGLYQDVAAEVGGTVTGFLGAGFHDQQALMLDNDQWYQKNLFYYLTGQLEVVADTTLKIQTNNRNAVGNYPSTHFYVSDRGIFVTPSWVMAEPPVGWVAKQVEKAAKENNPVLR